MTARARKLIAGYQMLGAAWTAFTLVWILPSVGSDDWIAVVMLGAATAVSALAAWLLWKDHPKGYRYSRLVQALQIIGLSVPGFVFVVRLGISVDVAFKGAGVESWPGTMLLLRLGTHSEPARLSVNFAALAAWWLLPARKPQPKVAIVKEAAALASAAGTLPREVGNVDVPSA